MSHFHTIQVATRENGKPDVRAFIPSWENRLAVHPQYFSDPAEIPKSGHSWTVTHIASGKGMGIFFPSRSHAVSFCEAIGERQEWDTVGPRGGQGTVPKYFAREVRTLLQAIIRVALH